MQVYFAPLEGITDATFRRLHHKHFGGADRYYMPFISPTIHRCLTHREARELPPADSESFIAIPQLLGKVTDDMLWAIDVCRELGYDEVNINLGCPSGTVVSKGKGSGMLSDPENLDRFLAEIYAKATLPVSVKTRIGMTDPDEFPRILDIYNQYPIHELTIHARVRKAFYSGDCNIEMFRYAAEHSRAPLCYNGNLNCLADIRAIEEQFPRVKSVMIGRGLVGNPGMLCGGTSRDALQRFLEEMSETYSVIFGSRRNAMFRMKENWHYLIGLFDGSEKLWKKLRKTTDYAEFCRISSEMIQNLPLRDNLNVTW